MILLALLLQAAPPVTKASAVPPERFSILLEPCAPVQRDGKEVVVCGSTAAASNRLPMPQNAPPTPGYVKPDSQDYRDNKMNEASPCATLQGGCQVGFGPPIMPVIAAAVNGIGNALKDRREARAKARDGDRRVAIDLGATAPAGRLEP